ncbi:MAG: ABC transporter ATP-binding protein [Pseudomonadota bacterium]
MTPALSLKNLSKSYPGVVACDDISVDLMPGEIHAIVGENGAGKSTLMKMIYGLVQPDGGTMSKDGLSYSPQSPREARSKGVSMIFQHFSLFEAMTVVENIALGLTHPPALDTLSTEIEEWSLQYGLDIAPHQVVGGLSAGARQRVEILRCILQKPKVLILDEPTSVLAPQEVGRLFGILRQLQADGISILYISHKLEEIRRLCEAATVLRQGRVVATLDPRKETSDSIAECMIGARHQKTQRQQTALKEIIFDVEYLGFEWSSEDPSAVHDVSFKLHRGEILGIAGIAGNGQDALFGLLSGEVRSASSAIRFRGEAIGHTGVRARRQLGILSAAEERLGHAAVPEMSLVENAALTAGRVSRRGFLNWPQSTSFARDIIETFKVATPSERTAAVALSGGNLQKYVIGRELRQNPSVFIVNQPTWGVDAAAAAAIRNAIIALAESGSGVITISQDLDELLEISDRIAVLSSGHLSTPILASTATPAKLGLLMAGEAA